MAPNTATTQVQNARIATDEEFMALMGQFKAAGKTLLIASHDPIVYGSPLADGVVELRDGRIVTTP